MQEGRLTLGSVRGIAIRIHRSWLVIAVLIAWSFYSRYTVDGRGVTVTLVMAATGTILFFASVLVHELAHSLEAQHRGVEVRGITLFLFGGATETQFRVERPRDEFALTAVGPFSSFVLGAAFGLVAAYSGRAGLDAVADLSGTLGWINMALGAFNLLPGAPLDGGRILRATVWAVTKDRGRAVRVAARAGQVMGVAIAGLGLLQLFFVPGALFGGIWFMFIGWFLATAAASELLQHEMSEVLEGVTVGEVVDDAPLPRVRADTTLEAAARELRRRPQDVLMVQRDGRPIGIVRLDDIADVPGSQRPHRQVGELVMELEELPTVPADHELADTVADVSGGRPLVVTGPGGNGSVQAIVTADQLQRIITRSLRLGERPSRRRRDPRTHVPRRGAT